MGGGGRGGGGAKHGKWAHETSVTGGVPKKLHDNINTKLTAGLITKPFLQSLVL